MKSLKDKTPVTNRGVTAPIKIDIKPLYDCIIDYFFVSLKKHSLNDIFSYFGNDYITLNSSQFCYDYTLVFFEKIKVLVSNRDDMNIAINLSGRACREIETHFNWLSFFTFIEMYKHSDINGNIVKNYNVTRLDYTFDYYNLDFDLISKINKHYDKNAYTSYLRRVDMHFAKDNKGNYLGRSFRFGKRGSDCSILFYDKLLERKNANHEIKEDIKNWYRMEVNFLSDTSNLIYEKIRHDKDNVTEYVLSLIYRYLDFKQLNNNTDRRHLYRCDTSKWWLKLLDITKKTKLNRKALQTSIDRKLAWFDKSVIKTLSLLYVTKKLKNGNDIDINFIDDYIKKGSKKINDYDLQLLNSYLLNNGLDKITKDNFNDLIDNLI